MAQSTFNNGDTLGVARTTINSNASDAETRLGILENDTSSFSYTEVTVAQSPYTLPAWDGIYGLHNDTAKIDLVLPEATAADLGKEIEFWVEHNTANHKVILKAPSQSMSINNVVNDGVDVARAEFSSNLPNFIRVKARCVGENKVYVTLASSVYNKLRYIANFSSTSNLSPYSYLQLDSVPTNFLTSNDDWWFAVKVQASMPNDTSGRVLFGSNNFFIAYRGAGDYLMTSSTSGYLQSLSPATVVESGGWIIYQYDSATTRYTAWINGEKVLNDSTSGATPPSTPPTEMWFGSETGQSAAPSGYGYPLNTSKISNISIGSGNLSDADAALFTSSTFTVPTLSSATLTNQWSPANGDVITTVTGSTNLALVGSDLSTEEI